MTAREMQKEFEQSADFIDAVNKLDLRIISDDVEFFLNEAQHVFINTRLKNFKKQIDNKQKDLDEIRTLIVKNTQLVLDAGSSTDEIRVYDLPSDYVFLISDYSFTTYCNKLRRYQNRLLSSEDLQEALHGTHTKPKFNSPVSEIVGSKLQVYRDFDLTFTINNVNIDYIKTWNSISINTPTNSELDSNTHKDIVQLAVNIFLEAVQSGRFTSNVDKNIITEQI